MRDISAFSSSRIMIECSTTLLLTHHSLINYFIRLTFSKTNAYDITAVTESLQFVEGWFKEILRHGKKLPHDFDSEFFCRAVSILFGSEHHVVVLRVLTMIYNYADIFTGESRRSLLLDLLIKKYFFQLFLHWESTVRNTYQQILAFKMLRMRRKVLKQIGVGSQSRFDGTNGGVMDNALDAELDGLLYGKIEYYIGTLHEVKNNGATKSKSNKMNASLAADNSAAYSHKPPENLEVYVENAIKEYRKYMEMYYQWEAQPDDKLPSLTPLSLIAT